MKKLKKLKFQIDEACLISKIEEYKPDQIIFSQFDMVSKNL